MTNIVVLGQTRILYTIQAITVGYEQIRFLSPSLVFTA